jgi:hypothetical protein
MARILNRRGAAAQEVAMRWGIRLVWLVCALVTLGAGDASAKPTHAPKPGDLDRFEDEATKKKKPEKADDSNVCGEADGGDSFTDAFLWELGRLSFYSTVYGGIGSWVRVHRTSSVEWRNEFPRRTLGEPLIPFLAAEGLYQDTGGDISATSLRTEIGYGPLGFEHRATRFEEQKPEDRMTLTQTHVLYRMSFSRYVGVNLGAGMATLEGNRETSGFSLTTPVQVYPLSFLGAEFRPAWAWIHDNTISDLSLVLVARRSVLSLKAGYRWVSAGSRNLDGPVVGVAVHF